MAAANNPTPNASTEPTVEDVSIPPLNIDTPQSDAAIDDIVAEEADTVLAAQDAGIDEATSESQPLDDAPERTRHPIFWFIVALIALVALIMVYALLQPGLELPFSAWL